MPKDKIFDKLVPLQVKLEPHQTVALKKEARKQRVSVSALIRNYVETAIILNQT